MSKWSHINFEGKHIDEKVLHFARPSKKQTIFEAIKIIFPTIIIEIILLILWNKETIGGNVFLIIGLFLFLMSILSVFYKFYRANRNFLYITSKRVFFHGIEGFFGDYMKKVSYENIINVNYFNFSLLGKMYGYGTLEIQTTHGGLGDIRMYNVEAGKMIALYIDKLMSLSQEERNNFTEFDEKYFKNWKK